MSMFDFSFFLNKFSVVYIYQKTKNIRYGQFWGEKIRIIIVVVIIAMLQFLNKLHFWLTLSLVTFITWIQSSTKSQYFCKQHLSLFSKEYLCL